MHQGLVAGDRHSRDRLRQLQGRPGLEQGSLDLPLPPGTAPTYHQDLAAAVLVLSQQPCPVGHQPILPGCLLPQPHGLSPLDPLLQFLG